MQFLNSNPRGYLLIIQHLANIVLRAVKPCYLGKNCTLPLLEFYTVYEIAV